MKLTRLSAAPGGVGGAASCARSQEGRTALQLIPGVRRTRLVAIHLGVQMHLVKVSAGVISSLAYGTDDPAGEAEAGSRNLLGPHVLLWRNRRPYGPIGIAFSAAV